jgi:hypothetical protein
MAKHHHSFGQESIMTGVIGAGIVALWFLVLDLIRGQAFTTPSVLGQVILFGNSTPELSRPVFAAVAAYTALHIAAFLILGALVTWLVFQADRHNIARFALLMLFVAFLGFFYGILVMFFQGTSGLFPVWSVLIANTLAAAGMGWYLLRRHPALWRGLAREPLGALE